MKVKVNFDVSKASKKFKDRFENLKRDPAWKEQAAELAIRKIIGDTRLGNYIKDGSKQDALSTSWVKRKEELSKYNERGTLFRNGSSNLTFTGQLLNSLKRTESDTQVIIEPTGDRTPYKNKDGKSSGKTPTNSELATYLKKNRTKYAPSGRRFLGYDAKLAKQIKKMLKEHLRRFLF